jgi:5'(3')-deoxyribonucleotidase
MHTPSKTDVFLDFDLDGVCCAFDERIIEVTGELPHILDARDELWTTVQKIPKFFRNLEPYPDMVKMVHDLKALGVPIRVITGRPRKDTMPTAAQEKIDWVHQHLGSDIDVIVCLSRDKQKHMKTGVTDILVDDRLDNIENWRRAGGVAIHHISYEFTRAQLYKLLNIHQP